jgi:hypothetical protein
VQLDCIREVGLFKFQGCLFFYIVRLEIEKNSNLVSHGLSMGIFVHKSQAVSIRPINQRVNANWSKTLALEFKPIVVHYRRQWYN